MQFAEIVITDQQAGLARVVIDIALGDPDRFVMTDEERADYERLAVFLGQVATNPEAFPVTGKNAAKIRGIIRKANGPAQPTRKPKRHARLEKRQSRQKFLRKNRRELAVQYNEAVAKVESDRAEMEQIQAEIEARIATQPKFQIKDVNGRIIVADVPAEAILRADGEPAFPQIIVPGT